MWEVFGADVREKEVFVTFLLKANGTLSDVATGRLVVVGCTALGTESTGHCPLKMGASFSSGLECCFAIRASVANSRE